MSLSVLTANFAGKIETKKLEGREYFVIPTVMMVEGVHNGSGGPLLYPGEELGRLPEVWDHKPIVIFHPKDGEGKPISACKPSVLEKDKVGVILNSAYEADGAKLKAESWLDKKRLKTVSPDVYAAVLKGTPVEVSIGVFTENETSEGEWNGEQYEAIARNYKPDHLAILPGLVGACSIEDGAGLGVNEAAEVKKTKEVIREFVLNGLTENDQSNNLLQEKLYRMLRARYGSVWSVEVFGANSYVVYELGDRFYKLTYSMSGDDPVLDNVPVMVDRVVEYRTATVTANETGSGNENDMGKKQLVDGLIANTATVWAEADRELLMGFTEERLTALGEKKPAEGVPQPDPQKHVNPGAGGAGTPEQNPEGAAADDAARKRAESQQNNQQNDTPDQWLKRAPASVRRLVENAARQEAEQRRQLISTIVANDDSFTEEELNEAVGDVPRFEIHQLQKMARAIGRGREHADLELNQYDPMSQFGFGGRGDFSGQGFPEMQRNSAKKPGADDGIDLPTTLDDTTAND